MQRIKIDLAYGSETRALNMFPDIDAHYYFIDGSSKTHEFIALTISRPVHEKVYGGDGQFVTDKITGDYKRIVIDRDETELSLTLQQARQMRDKLNDALAKAEIEAMSRAERSASDKTIVMAELEYMDGSRLMEGDE